MAEIIKISDSTQVNLNSKIQDSLEGSAILNNYGELSNKIINKDGFVYTYINTKRTFIFDSKTVPEDINLVNIALLKYSLYIKREIRFNTQTFFSLFE